ncbi:hypothetical protein [Labilibacter marinus]|uniref:hypothetical protein n=1 Tax=Labilibacter marinus TaxID=1477105 RepID=UPI0008339D12|nr:hypothetical protein [Labilibacter marinus]
MNFLKLMTLCLALVFGAEMSAQHEDVQHHEHGSSNHHAIEKHEHGKHKLAFYSGFTHVAAAFYEHETHEESTGKWIPTLGAEYYYTLSKKFDIGLIADIELDEYYIREKNEDELLRNNIVIAAAVARYKPIPRLGIFAGPGFETEFIENEDSKSFMVIKVGIDYEVEIENGWELTPIFSYDCKEEYSSYSFGISIGKRF